MARFLCMVKRGEAITTRPLDDAEDPDTVTADGYRTPAGLMDDPLFEANLLLDGADAWEVVTFEGERFAEGLMAASDEAIVTREVSREQAGVWLAAQSARGGTQASSRATKILEGASDTEAMGLRGDEPTR